MRGEGVLMRAGAEGVARGVVRTASRPAGGPTRSVTCSVTHWDVDGDVDGDRDLVMPSSAGASAYMPAPAPAPAPAYAPLSSFSGSAAPMRSLTNSKFLEEVSSSAMRSITKSMARRGVTRLGPEPAEAKGDSRGAPGVELGEAAVEPGVAVSVSLAPSAAVAMVVSAGGSDAPPPSLSSDAHR